MPIHDDQKLFEFLVLEGAQAGLSWITILRRRDGYRLAFDGFNPVTIAGFDQSKILELMQKPGLIRNQLKIASAVTNARAFLKVQTEFGSFDKYLWRFVDGVSLQNSWQTSQDVPASTPLAKTLSQDLKQRGFSFVGPTICYAFMQAVGMVNDHLTTCFRWEELKSK